MTQGIKISAGENVSYMSNQNGTNLLVTKNINKIIVNTCFSKMIALSKTKANKTILLNQRPKQKLCGQ